MARRLPTLAPIVGSVAGAGLNYMAVQATGKIAIEYYSSELEQKGRDQKTLNDTESSSTKATKKKSSRGTSKKSDSTGKSASKAGTSKPSGSKKASATKKKSSKSTKRSSSGETG